MPRLLAIDDDPVILDLLKTILTAHEMVTVATGEEGIEAYKSGRFDAVLCDLMLPGIKGFEAVRQIRAHDPSAKVLILTGHQPEANLIASLRESIIDFLPKPFTPEELRGAVDNLLGAEQQVQVISAASNWIELRVPASFQVVSRLDCVFERLHAGLDSVARESISMALRELLNNAIEHGCQGDPTRLIDVCYLRLSRVILYRIADPGKGFNMEELAHAAVGNPGGDPTRHLKVRTEAGMRAGGFGLLCVQGMADELIFNERGNQVVFARYIDEKPAGDKPFTNAGNTSD